jgi:tetratricopeptide (TPR) repeat protein
MSAESYKKLRIFVASPSDVASERAKVETVVAELEPLAEHIGVELKVMWWRDVVPDAGRPQQVIFNQLKPTSWEVFIGILWHRSGTPSGATNPQTGQAFASGTEEEFVTAYNLWKQYGKPRIMMYRCTRPFPFDVDPDQLKHVNEFFKLIEDPKSDYRVLAQKFDTVESFEKLLLDHLQKLLIAYSEQETRQTLTPQTIAVLAPPRIPDTLPRRVAFFGRDKEMDKVLRALGPEERGWGVVIDGIGGIGKTALAVEAAYRCKERALFDAFIFVSAKQRRLEPSGIKAETRAATTLDEFVNETTRALGKPGIAQLTGEDKRSTLLDALRTTRALLIYDNLETLTKEEQEALADWLRFLPQGCKAMLTSRRRGGEGALWLRLEKLDWETARAIIKHESEQEEHLAETLRRAGKARWHELYDETGGSPLALIWTLGLMRARALTFDRALEMLQQGAARESPLQEFIYQEARKELGTSDVATLNALSFFVPSATFEALMAVADLSRTPLETVLERLDALALVNRELGEERYSLHPLTRAYVRDELLADAKVARETGMRFARYWVEYAERYGGSDKESYKTYDRLEAEWANLDAAANWLWETAAPPPSSTGEGKGGGENAARMLNDLASALWYFCWMRGRWDEGVQLSERAYEAMRAMQDWSNAGWRAFDVAWIHYCRARTDDAVLWTDRCGDAWTRGGSRYEQSVATAMRGRIAEQRKDLDEAERLLQDALAIRRDLGLDADVAIVLNDLGGLERERKNYGAAERYFREALELARKNDLKEPQAYISGNLGELALDREQWAEARKWFEQELPLAKEVGRVELIAHAQYGLARVHEAEGRADLALPLAQEALKIFERLQPRDLAEVRELVERLREKVPSP